MKTAEQLALEYSQQLRYDLEEITEEERKEQKAIEYDFALPVIKWLLENNYIVSKEKVEEQKKLIETARKECDTLDLEYAGDVLENIFGNINVTGELNLKYIKVDWPDYQQFMEHPRFRDNCYFSPESSFSGSYFIPENLYNKWMKI